MLYLFKLFQVHKQIDVLSQHVIQVRDNSCRAATSCDLLSLRYLHIKSILTFSLFRSCTHTLRPIIRISSILDYSSSCPTEIIKQGDSKTARQDGACWTIHDGLHVVYLNIRQTDESVRGYTVADGFSFAVVLILTKAHLIGDTLLWLTRSSLSVYFSQQNGARALTFISSLHFRTILSLYFPSFSLTKQKLSATGGTYWSIILQQST